MTRRIFKAINACNAAVISMAFHPTADIAMRWLIGRFHAICCFARVVAFRKDIAPKAIDVRTLAERLTHHSRPRAP